uniref:Class I histocompatibility antigen, F10 alpha chain-like n=1 Tax=Pelodiscus sinensis TaxID=13735 RepID=K7FAM8_PELSI
MVTGVTYENGTYQYAMDIRLDGVRIGRYSSDTREVTPMLPWLGRALGSKYLQERTKEFQAHEQRLKEMIGWCMQQDSQRGGIHTGQVHIHCSLSDQAPVAPRFQFAYDGQDLISFDNQTGTWVADVPVASQLKQIWEKESTWTQYVQFFMRDDCLQTLRSLVQLRQWVLLSPVLPEVSVSLRDAPHGPVTLSCRASGFHPRPIHLSWVRDGGDVLAETSSSGILPLADGTYHTQSSLEIGPRPDGPRYACRVEHSSLPAPAL